MDERRREPRYEIRDAARITPLSDGLFDTTDCEVVNVSSNGLGLNSPIQLVVGAELKIKMREAVIFGCVRHCRKLASGSYELGVLVSDVVHGTMGALLEMAMLRPQSPLNPQPSR